MIGATPARTLDFAEVECCRVLSPAGAGYSDGSEGRLLEVVRAAKDLDSLSDELANGATDWADHYHLSRARANVLRSLDLTRCRTALELGAGCGAITRYLGEAGLVVDAIEPELARAKVARARTRDLPDVEVFVGTVEDLPTTPAYDLIIVVGVLEWVAGPSAGPSAALDFLKGIRARLLPEGALVIAIENQIGVKYLAGAPEDHSGRPFDGPEGYPLGAPARTFSRRSLESLLRTSGFEARFLHAFPDYKLTSLVLDDRAFDIREIDAFVRDAPPMPSAERGHAPHRVADERLVWQSLCEAGLGSHTANSYVVVATPSRGGSVLWDDACVGKLFANEHRRRAFGVESRVVRRSSGTWWIERRHLESGPKTRRYGPVGHSLQDSPVVPFPHFSFAHPVVDQRRWTQGILAWKQFVSTVASPRPGADFDLMPRNMLVKPDGDLEAIDREWWHESWTVSDVLARGLILAIPELSALADRRQLEGHAAARRVLMAIGDELGLEQGWLERGLDRERALHRELQGIGSSPAAFDTSTTGWRAAVNELLDRSGRPDGESHWFRRTQRAVTHPVSAARKVAYGTRRLLRGRANDLPPRR